MLARMPELREGQHFTFDPIDFHKHDCMYSSYYKSLSDDDELKADAIDILRAVLVEGVSLPFNNESFDFAAIREQYHSLRSTARQQIIEKLRERYVDLPRAEESNENDSKQLQMIRAMVG